MSIRLMVRKILSQVATCRDDDRELIFRVHQFRPDAHPATVIRYRAVFQNQLKLFPPIDPTVAKRRNRHK